MILVKIKLTSLVKRGCGMMRVIQDGFLYQLTSMPNFFPVNCYLIKEEDGFTLIDAALSFNAKEIIRVVEELNSSITKIVLTHAHSDHVGSLDAIKEKYSDAPVLISKRDARLMEGDRSLDQHEPKTPIKGGVPKTLKTRADILLNDGDSVGSLTALSTPGHTPGSMSFYDNRTGALIAGDAFQTRGGIAVAGDLRPLFPFPTFGTWNKEISLASAKKALGYNPTLLAVGHGELMKNPKDKMQEAIFRFEQK